MKPGGLVQPGLRRIWFLATRWIPWYPERRIGRAGKFRIHFSFLRYRLEGWGSGHNSQFHHMVEAAKSSRIALDVGAHVGFVSLPISHHQPKGSQLHAFEPAEANRRFLHAHREKNRNRLNQMEIHPLVVAESSRPRRFQEEVIPSAVNSCFSCEARSHGNMREATSLEDFCCRKDIFPDLIKIDTEGAEWECLAGAGAILERRPRLFLSMHSRGLEKKKDIEDILKSHQYQQAGSASISLSGKGEYFFHAG